MLKWGKNSFLNVSNKETDTKFIERMGFVSCMIQISIKQFSSNYYLIKSIFAQNLLICFQVYIISENFWTDKVFGNSLTVSIEHACPKIFGNIPSWTQSWKSIYSIIRLTHQWLINDSKISPANKGQGKLIYLPRTTAAPAIAAPATNKVFSQTSPFLLLFFDH